MRLIDTHTHIDFHSFDADRTEMLARCETLGVERILVLGVHQGNWEKVWQMALDEPAVYAALGMHPIFLEDHRAEHIDLLRDWLERLRGHDKLCAIGEIGLDYYIENPDKEGQQRLLDAQLDLANEFELPVLLHTRRCNAQMVATLKRHALKRKGIAHAFSGSWEEAREYIRLGYKIGLGGAGTWPQAHRMHRVLKQLPLECIVLETDAPDITPYSHAGERNSPEFLPDICRELATLRGISPEELAETSYRNSCELFGWS